MADHINIRHPDADEERRRNAIEVAELRARISVMELYEQSCRNNLDAIFTRIARGEEAELHYRDGTVIVIGAKEPVNG